jgi:hypothetical protein
VAGGFDQAADFAIDPERGWLIVANFTGRRVSFVRL